MSKLIIHSSHGKDDPERATLPFIMGNNAAIAGQEVVVLLTVDGVWLATRGGADGIAATGLPALAQILEEFIGNGGRVWACQACTKPRGIDDQQLIEGARIAAAMEAVELLSKGAASLTF